MNDSPTHTCSSSRVVHADLRYTSEGESFTLTDPHEAWVLELIGKGQGEKGAVWVAAKIPDGHVSAHANQARIRTVDCSDHANIRCAGDMVSFAQSHAFYDPKRDGDFSFSDVYDPVTFVGARACEARVWTFFSKVTSVKGFEAKYQDYVGRREVLFADSIYSVVLS